MSCQPIPLTAFIVHKYQRRHWDKAFQTKALHEYSPRMVKHYRILMTIFSKHATLNEPVDLSKHLMDLFFDVISDLTFGESFNALTTGSVGFVILNMWMFHLLRSIPIVASRLLYMMQWYASAISKRKEKMKNISPDLYTYLSQSDTFEANGIHEAQLAIIAGADTNAITVSNACYLLCRHPEYQEKLYEELCALPVADDVTDDQFLMDARAFVRPDDFSRSQILNLLAAAIYNKHDVTSPIVATPMAPNKQKIVAPKRPGAKRGRPPKSQVAPSSVPSISSTPGSKPLRVKLTFKRGETGQPDERDAPAYQFPLSAPPSEEATVQDDDYVSTYSVEDSQGGGRGARQRKPPQRYDVVYGSEMDNLITSCATVTKMDDGGDGGMDSSPPHIFNLRATDRYDSPMTGKGHTSLSRFNRPVSQDVYDILNSLRSSPEIQVDLPNMWIDEAAGMPKPYTGVFLISLYIQCYENSLWHICDLIADTWIRALQEANRRSQKSNDKRCHMWRKNMALEMKFKIGKLGFKKETEDLGLDVEDPDIAPDVAEFVPEHVFDLYAHTRPKCGARLLWADAMALSGRKMEADIVRHPDAWPKELFYDVMCTALRLVGRKLTLKIEEKYEGAWCRYHEHGKHGLPCYRQLAALQNGAKADGAGKGQKGARAVDGGEERDPKRVRFGGDARGK
ncbi:hypothetical protein E8E12_007966 [Didymella heteroderae]|uniref:Cytochrome P450 n=1 Tax=Didymella heteroderae TaxID=1769908 RepID=A0A9P4WT23_9PLEO|nr:hypothetical protein E8E12_007966 [Didymella heteroderae]